MPRAILNAEKTIVFTESLNIASSLTDINQRYLMQWCTIWQCSHSANIRPDIFKMSSSPLTRSPSVWQIDGEIGYIYLHVRKRFIFGHVEQIFIGGYIIRVTLDQGSSALESIGVYFHVLCEPNNKSALPAPLPSPFFSFGISPFLQTVFCHKGPDGKQWHYFYPCVVSAWAPVTWPDVRTTFSPPPKSHLGNDLQTVQEPIIMQSNPIILCLFITLGNLPLLGAELFLFHNFPRSWR